MMEPTVTQSGALYLAQHRIPKRRGNLWPFRRTKLGQNFLRIRPSKIMLLRPRLLDRHSR